MADNYSREAKIKKIYNFISSVNKKAYRDIYLISNQVLNKDPFTNKFLSRYLEDEDPRRHPYHIVISKILIYYGKSTIHFMVYLSKFFEYLLWSDRSLYRPKYDKELILIDEFFITDRIRKARSFQDIFFPGLETVLKEKGLNYAYIPFFYAPYGNRGLVGLSRVLRILKDQGVPVITEYQLLSLSDLLRIIYFIALYPFHVLKLAQSLNSGVYETRLLRYELIDTLDQTTFSGYSRYLLGRRAAKLPCKNIRVIGWYENQPLHKNFYKGIRSVSSKVAIYGAQFLLYPKSHLFLIPDDNESEFGVVPDRIIVNGPLFVPIATKLNFFAGPSLRHARLFKTVLKREGQRSVLVPMPYVREDAVNILRILEEADLSRWDVVIKAHPVVSLEELGLSTPSYARIVEGDIYNLLENARIVVGCASSTFIEAASLGIPVVLIKGTTPFEWSGLLSEDDRGIIWEEVSNPEDLIKHLENFERMRSENPAQLDRIAAKYKRTFFAEPTDELVSKAFDL